ncbi:MAG: phosphoribosyltransferase family protein [Dehalococcoidia bacterium]
MSEKGRVFPWGTEANLTLSGALPDTEALDDLLRLMTRLVSVNDDADVSHCLDLYRIPEESAASPEEWPHTEIGQAVYRAKYRGDYQSSMSVADAMTEVSRTHPALASADVLCAVPPASDLGNRTDAADQWVRALSERLGVPATALRRIRTVRPQKGIEDTAERRRNQERSMDADPDARERRVLVVDDLYTSGDTVRESVRTLRAEGASQVFVLCAVKTAKGTQGLGELLEAREDWG